MYFTIKLLLIQGMYYIERKRYETYFLVYYNIVLSKNIFLKLFTAKAYLLKTCFINCLKNQSFY